MSQLCIVETPVTPPQAYLQKHSDLLKSFFFQTNPTFSRKCKLDNHYFYVIEDGLLFRKEIVGFLGNPWLRPKNDAEGILSLKIP